MRVRILLATYLLTACCILRADDRTQQLIARLSQEADAFRKLAPNVVGQETLFQRAQKPPARGWHVRIAGANAPPPVWQERRMISEYSFAAFAGEGGAIHELRRVTSLDGRKLQDAKKAQDELAAIVMAADDKRKKELLTQFEKYGLLGAVTDFGQLLLLFTSGDVQHYEFTFRRVENQGTAHLLVFGYQQIDGAEALTVIDGRRGDQARNLRLSGEVWVRENSFQPVRVTLLSGQDGPDLVREEASVEYAMSSYGAVLPFFTEHRELRGTTVVAENKFSYTDFRKFGASSDIKFQPQ
jgi:hypothetical protein